MNAHTDDFLPDEPDGEVVHWMEPRTLSLGLSEVTIAALGAFILGVAATFGALAAAKLLEDRGPPPSRRWRL